jgi:hypothetical protein
MKGIKLFYHVLKISKFYLAFYKGSLVFGKKEVSFLTLYNKSFIFNVMQ